MKSFGSDNHSGIHPLALAAIVDANLGHAPSYGTDQWTNLAVSEFRRVLGCRAEVFFVYNGTAANALVMRALCKPWQSIFCADISHLNIDECGAPEFFAGAKLHALPSKNGKISLPDLKAALVRKGDQHYSQPKVVSLTQPTELGTCYSIEEIREITAWAHSEGLVVHIDGARLANAAVFLGCDFKTLLTDSGVDAVSFGGTKNGLLMGEAVIFLQPQLCKDFQYIRKQSAQLPSKTRFISASFLTYLQGDLWHKIASHGLEMAQLLAKSVESIPGVEITQVVQSNAVFARIPQRWVKPLREKYFFYVWDEKSFECRWMMSFDTSKEEVMDFASALRELSTELKEKPI